MTAKEVLLIDICVVGEVQQEIDHIFELAKSLNLLVLECESINHPSQLQKSTLAPIVIYLKIASAKVMFILLAIY